MKYGKLFILVMVLVIMASCSSQQYFDVFPQISHLERVWQDESGQLYSAVRDENGEFVVHNPATGSFFRYRLEQKDGPLQARPAHAPPISYQNGILRLGDNRLSPARVISRKLDFENADVHFSGVLTIPTDVDGPVPVVVNAHGSEQASAVSYDWAASWYSDVGFATYIFDKRGTGQSGGGFTHDFDLLASDLEAAVNAVAQQVEIDNDFIGVGGYSQGVYVGTLAASRNPAIRFLIAGYGVMEPPVREDFLETKLHFEANYPELSWEAFAPLVEACEQAFAMGDDSRWQDVSAQKRQWRGRIDPGHLSGTLVGDGCLRWPPIALRLVGDSQFPPGLKWGFDPAPLMAELDIPVLFQYGEADEDAPMETSVALVQNWIDSGKPFTLYTYPGAAHGMYMTAIDSAGNRYRYKEPEYVADLLAWLALVRTNWKQGQQISQY